MRISLMIVLSIISTACSQNTDISQKQLVHRSPTSIDEVGYVVSHTSKEQMALLAEQNPTLKIRIINEKHGLFEVYGMDKEQLRQLLPGALISKNEFFVPHNFTHKQKNQLSDILLLSESNDKDVPQADPKACEKGKFNPTAVIKKHDSEENRGFTIELGQSFQVDAGASLAHPNAPSELKYVWAIQPPEGSLKEVELIYGQEAKYRPDALGSYTIMLLAQDERNKCDIVVRALNVTTNREYIGTDILDQQKNEMLTNGLSMFSQLSELNVPNLWSVTTGKAQLIAIIDSGINYNHFSLKESIQFNSNEIPNNGIDDDANGFIDDYLGYDFANDDAYPYDDHGHGSHVAGLAASSVFGVAKEAKVLAIKAMTPSGGDMGTVAGAILYAVDQGATIINVSLGNYGEAHPHLELAMSYAETFGALVVAAAGNGDRFYGLPVDTDKAPNFPSALENNNIVAVAAKSKEGLLAPYSNFGKTSVDVVAPGGDSENLLYSAFIENPKGIDIKGMSGTSMATPIVAGVAALAWSLNPQLSHIEIKNILLQSGNEIEELKEMVVSSRYLSAEEAINKSMASAKGSQD